MYQKITTVGNLGRDPEMRYLPSGTPVTNFSVGTNRRWTGSDGQQQEETAWFRVSTFGRLAEVCNQYLSKGRRLLVEGRMRPDETGGPRVWQGNDGQYRASFEVSAQRVLFLGGRGSNGQDAAPMEEPPPEEEIPF